MKINITPRADIDVNLTRILKDIAYQVNGISEGRISARYTAQTAAPSTGTWARGDFVSNSEPSESGSGGSKYVIDGWKCVTGGTPGTWVECRYLTGN